MPGIVMQAISDDATNTARAGTEAEASHTSQAPQVPQLNHPSSPLVTRLRPDRATVRNRRLQYLTSHASTYFTPDLELADPLLYDLLIRQHQTALEREAEGRAKGWSGILHADLSRSEAKIAALQDTDAAATLETRAQNSLGQEVTSKEEAEAVWREVMTLRFLEGRDQDADYEKIDNSEEYDDYAQIDRDAQDRYFDAETPSADGEGDTGVQDF